ncbi:MAG: hypothetical protein WB786_03420 [Thermoplasmata archaeon]
MSPSPKCRVPGRRGSPEEEVIIPTKPRSYAPNWKVPTSLGLWGGSAEERCRLAWALAHRIDPEFYWLQVDDPVEPRDPAEDTFIGRLASDHLFVLNPSELAPHPELGNMASWIVREDIEADARIRALGDFMGLPNLARRLLEDRSEYSPTKVLVYANSDRASSYYGDVGLSIRPFVEAMNHYAATPIFTVVRPTRPSGAGDVDYLLHLEGEGRPGGSTTKVECLSGASPGVSGLFTTGTVRDLSTVLEEIESS